MASLEISAFKTKRLIQYLEKIKGNGTSCITLQATGDVLSMVKTNPEEKVYIKQLLTTLQSGVM